MGEYKRWISYIYDYERGIKGVNAGYVRVESRNNRCRLTVNIKGSTARGDALTIYLFYRNGADMIMVYAGEGEFYNGVCEFIAETSGVSLFGSGKNINEMGGVIAYSTMDKFYGTEWDDKPIVLRKLIEHSEYENKINNRVVTINSGLPEVDTGMEIVDEIDIIEDKIVENEAVEDKAAFQEPELTMEEEIMLKEVEKDLKENLNQHNEISKEEKWDASINKENADKSDSRIARIFSKMPGMYPFEDDEVIDCVKFEPQDIGVFPMEKWPLANNSFLLHGYYTYRHLIFARRRTEEGVKCMLGVPGMFRDRERFMAGMFGFGQFKSVRNEKTHQYGEFGYWYMDIDMF